MPGISNKQEGDSTDGSVVLETDPSVESDNEQDPMLTWYENKT